MGNEIKSRGDLIYRSFMKNFFPNRHIAFKNLQTSQNEFQIGL